MAAVYIDLQYTLDTHGICLSRLRLSVPISHKRQSRFLYFRDFQSINQSINLFVMKHSTCDIAVTALTGTTRLKSAYGSPK